MKHHKVAIVMPGYNVADILPVTVSSLPTLCRNDIILVDDGSTDSTATVGRTLGLQVISHSTNKGYGGAQKTGYKEAIRKGYDIVVLVHGDNQYDPSLALQFAEKIIVEGCEVVTGTRFILGDVLKGGMPIWKYVSNRLLTQFENFIFSTNLTDYHDGYRAYCTQFLKKIPFHRLSDKFDFDTDLVIQAVIRKAKILEIPHETRYNPENSQMPFITAVKYGFSILKTTIRFTGHRLGLKREPLYSELK